jgi:hypothetical protein
VNHNQFHDSRTGDVFVPQRLSDEESSSANGLPVVGVGALGQKLDGLLLRDADDREDAPRDTGSENFAVSELVGSSYLSCGAGSNFPNPLDDLGRALLAPEPFLEDEQRLPTCSTSGRCRKPRKLTTSAIGSPS